MNTELMFSKKSDEWSTPKVFYDVLDKEFGFTFDPCPLNATQDALSLSWPGRVYVNPPYSNIRAFLEKGIEQVQIGNAEVVVYLIPARTDTRWFHDLVQGKSEVRFLRGRLVFGNDEHWQEVWDSPIINGKPNKLYQKYGKKNAAPFPSMLVIFRRGRSE